MEGQNVLKHHPESHSDLEKFKLGGVDLQVFSIWVSPDEKEKKYFENANDMINKLNFLISRVPKDWGLAKSYQDITYNSRKNKMSCVIGVEGGHIIGRDISKLEALHDRGMRYLGLTWNNSNHIASSAKDETFNRNSYRISVFQILVVKSFKNAMILVCLLMYHMLENKLFGT